MSMYVTSDEVRDKFATAMSQMYQAEVPQYGDLLKLVAAVNSETLAKQPALSQQLTVNDELARLSVERHGAIRVGTAQELGTLKRLFAVMGMYPVGYYDLSAAGVPVHSTAFRPIEKTALARNPFRIFTSLLRLELIESPQLRAQAADILAKRDIFTPRVRELIEVHEQQGALTSAQAHEFVTEALATFRWHQEATVDLATYQALHDEHRLIADVVCFRGPHINHLTPRTLDIDEVQRRMPLLGMEPKAVIEGPPRRHSAILLRQTSFTALKESIRFADQQAGAHTARFGEIEQRGMALTVKGRALYDELLTQAQVKTYGLSNLEHQQILADVFQEFPDNETELRRQGLAFFEYHLTQVGQSACGTYDKLDEQDKEQLIEQGLLIATPLTYEDFLPVSAAGIFQSNLGGGPSQAYQGNANQAEFEQALGAKVVDELALYASQEHISYQEAIQKLMT